MSKPSDRIDALDVLRGLALAAMLLVNNPGSWSHVYPPLLHASWHGLTPTDLVFPFFLFVVGAAMAYSFKQSLMTRQFDWLSIYRRSFLLIAIGILLSAIPYQAPVSEWRLPGVLQRIGLCYLLAAILLRYVSTNALFTLSVLILVLYQALLIFFATAQASSPYAPQGNAVQQLDMFILGTQHMYTGLGFAFDPEGILSTLPATVSVLSGYLVTHKLQNMQEAKQKIQFLLITGIITSSLGLFWHLLPSDSIGFPINKSLWSSSYVLVTSGIACLVLALIIAAWDLMQCRRGLHALQVYGSNPIFLFVLAGIVARALILIEVESNEESQSIKNFIYSLLTQIFPEKIASLLFAMLFMLVFYLIARWLHKRKIFIKL